jgi:hypothetical protein
LGDMFPLTTVSNLMMVQLEMAETCSCYVFVYYKYSCVFLLLFYAYWSTYVER